MSSIAETLFKHFGDQREPTIVKLEIITGPTGALHCPIIFLQRCEQVLQARQQACIIDIGAKAEEFSTRGEVFQFWEIDSRHLTINSSVD
jgi:hypothetical protein